MKRGKLIVLFLIAGCLYAIPDARAQTATPTATATATATATTTATATATTTPTISATPTATATSSPCALSTPSSTSGLSGRYTCCLTQVGSSVAPVQVKPPWPMTTWSITWRTGGAAPVLIFPYSGTLPSTAPANAHELSSQNSSYSDSVGVATPSGLNGIGEAWAAVLETGSTQVPVDACWR